VVNKAATANSLYINPSGNVGIGTIAPTTKLDIQTAVGFNRGLLIGPKTSTDGDGGYIEFTSSSVDGFGAQIGGLREGGAGINSLVFRTGGNTQTERMRITNAGNVGIGTTTPAAKLSVNQGSATTIGQYISGYANATADLFRISTSTLTATSTAFVIDANGRVGVGTSTPYTQLGVQGGIAGDFIQANQTTATSSFSGGLTVNSTGVMLNQGTPANTLVTTAGGNVGIGTAAPQAELDVYSTSPEIRISTISATGDPALRFTGNPYNNIYDTLIWNDNSESIQYFDNYGNGNDFDFRFRTKVSGTPINALTIKGNGNVGIGETAPGSKLSVSGGGSFGAGYDTTAAPTNGLIVEGNTGIGTTSPAAKLSVQQGSATTIGEYISGYANATADLFRISTSTLTATSTAFVIDSQGRVGVGTTTPYAQLSVAGLTASGYYNADSTTATSTFQGGMTLSNKSIYPNFDKAFGNLGSSTPDYQYNTFNTASSTFLVWNPSNAIAATRLFCKVDAGTVTVELGTGLASTTVVATASGATAVSTVTWDSRDNVMYIVKTASGLPNVLSCTGTFYNQ